MTPTELAPGTDLPVFSRPADLSAWNRYAAVNEEFVPIHMDDEAGREAGFAGAIGMGNLSLAYLHCLLRDWAGERGRIARIEVSYRQPSLRNSVVTAHGRIAEVVAGAAGRDVTIELWVDDDAGRALLNGKALVTLPVD